MFNSVLMNYQKALLFERVFSIPRIANIGITTLGGSWSATAFNELLLNL